MFNGCTSLTAAPALPATTLATYCYRQMFDGCTSLTQAPDLPATTANALTYVYYRMFYNCTGLERTGRIAIATATGTNALAQMFYGCSNLKYIELSGMTAWSTRMTNWVNGVSANGLFVCPSALGTESTITRGTANCPTGWSVENEDTDCLCFEAQEANCVINMAVDGSVSSSPEVHLLTSAAGIGWTEFDATGAGTTPITLANVGDKVYFKATDTNSTFCTANESARLYFTTSKQCKCSGNAMSLLAWQYKSLTTISAPRAFEHLFWESKITTAPELPATTLSQHCYEGMFDSCYYLTTPPALPATTLAASCYQSMFNGCTSLVSAPALPATTLAASCYNSMFSGCVGLSSVKVSFTAWALGSTDDWMKNVSSTGIFLCPSQLGTDTTIARGASNCPANWTVYGLDWGLYFEAEEAGATVGMAKSGTPPAVTLEYSTDGANTWNTYDADAGTTIQLSNIGDRVYFRAGPTGNTAFASSAAAYRCFTTGAKKVGAHGNIMSLLDANDPGKVILDSNYTFTRIFFGCSSLTSAPSLPATTLRNCCYGYMFSGCTSLATAPTLSAFTANNCYRNMFEGCTSLTTAPALPATELANFCYAYMFQGCSSLTTAPTLPATALKASCYRQMFYGCTSLTTAPALPATTAAALAYVYYQMFMGCTSLQRTQDIAMTTATGTNALMQMFSGCTDLAYIVLTGMTSWSTRMTSWVDGVAASGTFKCPAALGDDATITRGTSNCPTGWTVVNI